MRQRVCAMRSLKRNQRLIHYAEYGGKVPVLDEDGYETGEEEPIFGDPKPLWINVSAAKGNAYTSIFGDVADYTHVLGPADPGVPIDEQSAIWIDANTDEQPDYRVTRIAKGLNATHYAVKKVR